MSIWCSIRTFNVSLHELPAIDDDGTSLPSEPPLSFDVASTWYPTVRLTVWGEGHDVYTFLTPEQAQELGERLLAAARIAASER
jgi:hypothetical protein